VALAELEQHTLTPVLSRDERKLEERVGGVRDALELR